MPLPGFASSHSYMNVIRNWAADHQPRRQDDGARKRDLTWGQTLFVGALLLLTAIAWLKSPEAFLGNLVIIAQAGFLFLAVWRILLVIAAVTYAQPNPMPVGEEDLPAYTIMAALYQEADVVSQLIERLERIDYPPDRLEVLLLLEAHDLETQAAAEACKRPAWLSLVIVPPGSPQTKPRALNYGLARARGEFITVYDAEDEPDPFQLREAVSRFGEPNSANLACLQAPLRIRRRTRAPGVSPFLDRQFAVEYAALFGVTLPAMARLNLPFPLGGTSNHFRAEALRSVGGWDAWNVTEDADVGFQLWRNGWRLGVLERPTYESPPGSLEHWLPQRVRWLKGYMQTLGVHTRDPASLGCRGLLSLFVTMGGGLASAASHALAIAWAAAWVLVSIMAGLSPGLPMFGVGVLVLALAAAWLQCAIGARRVQVPYTAVDMITAPAYWSLLTLAFLHATWRLVHEPFVWDKTMHLRDEEPVTALPIAPNAGRQAA